MKGNIQKKHISAILSSRHGLDVFCLYKTLRRSTLKGKFRFYNIFIWMHTQKYTFEPWSNECSNNWLRVSHCWADKPMATMNATKEKIWYESCFKKHQINISTAQIRQNVMTQ